MDKNAVKMEIKRLADYLSLKYTRFILVFFLLLNFVLSTGWPTGPFGLYSTFIALVVPVFISSLLKNRVNKEGTNKAECEYHLSSLLSHYHFSAERLSGETVAFYIIIVVLMLWQKRNAAWPSDTAWCDYYPALLMSFGVIVRLILYIFHRFFLPYKTIKHNY